MWCQPGLECMCNTLYVYSNSTFTAILIPVTYTHLALWSHRRHTAYCLSYCCILFCVVQIGRIIWEVGLMAQLVKDHPSNSKLFMATFSYSEKTTLWYATWHSQCLHLVNKKKKHSKQISQTIFCPGHLTDGIAKMLWCLDLAIYNECTKSVGREKHFSTYVSII